MGQHVSRLDLSQGLVIITYFTHTHSYQFPEMDEWDSSRASSTHPFQTTPIIIVDYDVIWFAELAH
jgi:hypothetical protein